MTNRGHFNEWKLVFRCIYPKRPKVFEQPKVQFIQQNLAKAKDDIQSRNLCVCLNRNSRLKKLRNFGNLTSMKVLISLSR